MTAQKPTQKQSQLLEYLSAYISQNGYSPSYREIMQALGYKSISTVSSHVSNLIDKGLLKKSDNAARSLEVVQTKQAVHEDHLVWLKRTIKRRIEALKKDGTHSAVKDAKVLERAADVLGVPLSKSSKN